MSKPAKKAIGPKLRNGPNLAQMANITAVMGASGAGKSTFVRQQLKKDRPARLMIWDLKGEFGDIAPITENLATVTAMVRQSRFAVIFKPTSDEKKRKQQFDLFCKVAYAAHDVYLVVEELAFVTSPSHACAGWSQCTLLGRDRNMKIIGTSQRPASIDKNFFGNASTVRTGRLNFASDKKVLAEVLEVPLLEIQNLQPLQFIEKNMNTGTLNRGSLTI